MLGKVRDLNEITQNRLRMVHTFQGSETKKAASEEGDWQTERWEQIKYPRCRREQNKKLCRRNVVMAGITWQG